MNQQRISFSSFSYWMHRASDRSDQHWLSSHLSTYSLERIPWDEVQVPMWLVIFLPNVAPIRLYCKALQLEKTILSAKSYMERLRVNSQLSKTVLHFCSSNGYFCKFIQQCRVAWMRVDMMTVPSGEIDVSTSFSGVPRTDEVRSLAKKRCGIQSESLKALWPMIGSLRFWATFRNTKRGSTQRNWSKVWTLNSYHFERIIGKILDWLIWNYF